LKGGKIKMAKKRLNWWLLTLFMVAGSIAVFGIGAKFFGGDFLDAFALSVLPKLVHQAVGILLMISGVGGLIGSFVRK
jgi:hypothetical protein